LDPSQIPTVDPYANNGGSTDLDDGMAAGPVEFSGGNLLDAQLVGSDFASFELADTEGGFGSGAFGGGDFAAPLDPPLAEPGAEVHGGFDNGLPFL
jgi:hypothetical protein